MGSIMAPIGNESILYTVVVGSALNLRLWVFIYVGRQNTHYE